MSAVGLGGSTLRYQFRTPFSDARDDPFVEVAGKDYDLLIGSTDYGDVNVTENTIRFDFDTSRTFSGAALFLAIVDSGIDDVPDIIGVTFTTNNSEITASDISFNINEVAVDVRNVTFDPSTFIELTVTFAPPPAPPSATAPQPIFFPGTPDPDIFIGQGSIDTAYGGESADQLFGDAGSDLLYGNQGNDLLYGNGGADTIYGGQGIDTIYGGTSLDDSGDSANLLYGNNGDDLIVGNDAGATIYGGEGADTAYGGASDDLMFGGDGKQSSVDRADLLYGGAGRDSIYGNAGDDRLFGNQGDDLIFGGQGNDFIHGGKGNDTLQGGIGNDKMNGGIGADLFIFAQGGGNDRIEGFNFGEGDRLDLGGQTFTRSFADGNIVLTLVDGDTITLVGTDASSQLF